MGLLGFEHGIVQAPLGPDISGPLLVSAVANAGAIGMLRAPDQDDPDILRELIKKTRELTEKPFGVAIVLAFPHEKMLQAVLDEHIALLMVSWGDFDKELVDKVHSAGTKVIHQVGSVEDAKAAALAGVDAIIAQSIEAGGHVLGKVGLLVLVPAVVDAVKSFNIPVIAAGGICDARGYVAALALGAKGVCLGTRFIASEEAFAHPIYKKKLLEAGENDTEYTDLYGRARWPDAPHRVLKTPFFMEWKDKLPKDENEQSAGQPVLGETIVHNKKQAVPRFSGKAPNCTTTGNIEDMAMYAGEGVGLIKELLPAASIINELVKEAGNIVANLQLV